MLPAINCNQFLPTLSLSLSLSVQFIVPCCLALLVATVATAEGEGSAAEQNVAASNPSSEQRSVEAEPQPKEVEKRHVSHADWSVPVHEESDESASSYQPQYPSAQHLHQQTQEPQVPAYHYQPPPQQQQHQQPQYHYQQHQYAVHQQHQQQPQMYHHQQPQQQQQPQYHQQPQQQQQQQQMVYAEQNALEQFNSEDIGQNLVAIQNHLRGMQLMPSSRQQLQLLLQRQHIEHEELKLRHFLELEKFLKQQKEDMKPAVQPSPAPLPQPVPVQQVPVSMQQQVAPMAAVLAAADITSPTLTVSRGFDQGTITTPSYYNSNSNGSGVAVVEQKLQDPGPPDPTLTIVNETNH